MPKRYEAIKKSVGGDKSKAARIYNATRKSDEPPVTRSYDEKHYRKNRRRIGA